MMGTRKAVTVDGTRYDTLAKAAKAIKVCESNLSVKLNNGGGSCEYKGHQVAVAEDGKPRSHKKAPEVAPKPAPLEARSVARREMDAETLRRCELVEQALEAKTVEISEAKRHLLTLNAQLISQKKMLDRIIGEVEGLKAILAREKSIREVRL